MRGIIKVCNVVWDLPKIEGLIEELQYYDGWMNRRYKLLFTCT